MPTPQDKLLIVGWVSRPSLYIVQELREESINFSGELPQTGDYFVIVWVTRDNANYTLEVAIR